MMEQSVLKTVSRLLLHWPADTTASMSMSMVLLIDVQQLEIRYTEEWKISTLTNTCIVAVKIDCANSRIESNHSCDVVERRK